MRRRQSHRALTSLLLVTFALTSTTTPACDWEVAEDVRPIEVPIGPWHTAPEDKKLVRLTYRVQDGGRLRFTRTLEFTYPFLGAVTGEIGEEEAGELGVPEYSGIRVLKVVADSAADQSGLMEGDIIVKANGKALNNPKYLTYMVQNHDPAAPLVLEVKHRELQRILTIPLDRKSKQEIETKVVELPISRDGQHTGMTFGELIEPARTDILGEQGNGLVVMEISGGSPGFYSNIRSGDVISAVDGRPVVTGEDLLGRIAVATDQRRALTFTCRRGRESYVESVRPTRDLKRDFRLKLPLVMDWQVSPQRTDFDLGMGLILDYTRRARVRGARHQESSKFGIALDIIKFESNSRGKSFSLLWITCLRW